MSGDWSARNIRDEIARVCHRDQDLQTLRREVVGRLKKVVPADAWCWPTADPATLIVTGAQTEGIPPGNSRRFFEIEYTSPDFNKFSELAHSRRPVGSLSQATEGDLSRSRRYTEVFGPLGIGEDLRVALRTGGACWGYLVLHRTPERPFTTAEADYVLSLAEHLAEGVRTGLFHGVLGGEVISEGPGVVVLSNDLEVVTATETGARWLDELETSGLSQGGLPNAVHSVVSKLRALENAAIPPGLMPRARVLSRTGRWLVVHASRLGNGPGAGQIKRLSR